MQRHLRSWQGSAFYGWCLTVNSHTTHPQIPFHCSVFLEVASSSPNRLATSLLGMAAQRRVLLRCSRRAIPGAAVIPKDIQRSS